MKASAFEFRFRFILHGLIFLLGFWCPWNDLLHLDAAGPNAHVWGLLSASLAQTGALNIGAAFNLLLALGIAFALAGAILRTWGSSYLGPEIVQDSSMHAGIVADGPYRHLRNPLYLGTFLHAFALALLMPRSGAIFTILAIGLLQLRLILAEESFLAAKLGPPYLAFKAKVPRLLPSLKPRLPASRRTPQWFRAVLGEIYMWGVALSFALLGWRYNASLLIRCILISLGVSIVLRALQPSPPPALPEVV